jgi:hypothetical protein
MLFKFNAVVDLGRLETGGQYCGRLSFKQAKIRSRPQEFVTAESAGFYSLLLKQKETKSVDFVSPHCRFSISAKVECS